MLCPEVHSFVCCLDVCNVLVASVLYHVRYPVNCILDASGNVSKHLMRSHYHEHVGEVLDGESQERADAVTPDILQLRSVYTLEVNCVKRASHCIEAGRVYEDVEVMRLIGRLNARLGDPLNGVLVYINQFNVGLIESFIIATLKRYSSCAKAMVLWNELLSYSWVVQSGSDLLCVEFAVEIVGSFVGENIR